MVPIDPAAVFLLVQSGYDARFLFEWALESVNGIRNRSRSADDTYAADPAFERLMELMSRAQREGAFGVRVERGEADRDATVVFFRRENLSPEIAAAVGEARSLLGLDPQRDRFRVVFSPIRGAPDELAVQSRSIIQVLLAMGTFMQARPQHVEDGMATRGATGDPRRWPLRIHGGADEPEDAFAAIRYAGHWFWIERGDLVSKRAFFLVTFLFALSDTSGSAGAPVLTIPAG
jgi:hypothetical protein